MKECEEYIRKKIVADEQKIVREINIDSRVHSRIIGGQGKSPTACFAGML